MTNTEIITTLCPGCRSKVGISVAMRPHVKRAGNRRRLVKALLEHMTGCSGSMREDTVLVPKKWLWFGSQRARHLK